MQGDVRLNLGAHEARPRCSGATLARPASTLEVNASGKRVIPRSRLRHVRPARRQCCLRAERRGRLVLGIVRAGCGLLMLGPYDSASNGIEYVHHIEKCYLRRNPAFARAAPMTALYMGGSMITPQQCSNIMAHVLGF